MCLLCLGTVELSKGPQRIYLLQEWTLVNSATWFAHWERHGGGCVWKEVKVKNAENQLCDAVLRERNKRQKFQRSWQSLALQCAQCRVVRRIRLLEEECILSFGFQFGASGSPASMERADLEFTC